MNKDNRTRAINKFIKHNHKFHLESAAIGHQKGRMEYGVVDKHYLTDGACLVYTSEDLHECLQSENHCETVMERFLKEKDKSDNIGTKHTIDFNKLIADAKKLGFKDTFKQQEDEWSDNKYAHVVCFDDACYRLRLINKAFQCINDGKVATLTQVKRPMGTKGKYTKALHVQTDIGECYLLNFVRNMDTEIPLREDFKNVYDLLDYEVI